MTRKNTLLRNTLMVILAVAGFIAGFALVTHLLGAGMHFDSTLADTSAQIFWEKVNVRESHSTNSEVLVILSKGDKVSFTGKTYSILGGNGAPTEDWVELTGGGWIIQRSIDWSTKREPQ